ncbi:MAG: ABC transporter ATP-binding protein [Candidatus Dormibacterales bacterium]
MKPPVTAAQPFGAGHRELVARCVSYRAGGRLILDRVSVAAVAGRALAVTGPSGSGKTTLMLILAGLLAPAEGVVLLDGAPLRVGGAVRKEFGIVLQGYGLVPVLSALENVALPLQDRGLSRGEVKARSAAALAEVGLSALADHLAEELSGGQQQRVAVARVLAASPLVLLADEPTSELDAENRVLMMGLLLSQARAGKTVVIASHDPEVADSCDMRVRLADGRVVG